MDNLDQLKGYLRHVAKMRSPKPDWQYSSVEELLLDLARSFERIPTPPELIFFNETKQCYRNCLTAAVVNDSYRYVEGYWLPCNGFPVEHAWLMSPDGKAIDPTDSGTGGIYFGVPLERSWVTEMIGLYRPYPLILRGHYDQYHLLRHGLPKDAIAPSERRIAPSERRIAPL